MSLLLGLLHLLLTHLVLLDNLGLLKVLLGRLLRGLTPIDMGMELRRSVHPVRGIDRNDVLSAIVP
nr:hypothetical protein [Xanthomonas phaseoli]